jgi:hypothetical protein
MDKISQCQIQPNEAAISHYSNIPALSTEDANLALAFAPSAIGVLPFLAMGILISPSAAQSGGRAAEITASSGARGDTLDPSNADGVPHSSLQAGHQFRQR